MTFLTCLCASVGGVCADGGLWWSSSRRLQGLRRDRLHQLGAGLPSRQETSQWGRRHSEMENFAKYGNGTEIQFFLTRPVPFGWNNIHLKRGLSFGKLVWLQRTIQLEVTSEHWYEANIKVFLLHPHVYSNYASESWAQTHLVNPASLTHGYLIESKMCIGEVSYYGTRSSKKRLRCQRFYFGISSQMFAVSGLPCKWEAEPLQKYCIDAKTV